MNTIRDRLARAVGDADGDGRGLLIVLLGFVILTIIVVAILVLASM